MKHIYTLKMCSILPIRSALWRGVRRTAGAQAQAIPVPVPPPLQASCQTIADAFCEFISSNTDDQLVLLRNPSVVKWITADLSFLSEPSKEAEDTWGRNTLRALRPDLKADGQWTNIFGEYICKEIYRLMGQQASKPVKKEKMQPDLETETEILEVKTGTYFTTGTAHEKILGTPFKYADVPILYRKPLKIVCIAGAEKTCREQYGNLPSDTHQTTEAKLRFLEFFRLQQIEYIAATELIKKLMGK